MEIYSTSGSQPSSISPSSVSGIIEKEEAEAPSEDFRDTSAPFPGHLSEGESPFAHLLPSLSKGTKTVLAPFIQFYEVLMKMVNPHARLFVLVGSRLRVTEFSNERVFPPIDSEPQRLNALRQSIERQCVELLFVDSLSDPSDRFHSLRLTIDLPRSALSWILELVGLLSFPVSIPSSKKDSLLFLLVFLQL